jgi:hypothetical protein
MNSFISSMPDVCLLNSTIGANNFRNITGRTRVSALLAGGENTAVIIVTGQSNAANNVDTKYTPSNSKVENLNLWDGGIYRADDAMLGTDAIGTLGDGSWIGRLGDKLITDDTYDRVIFAPIAINGSSAEQWAANGDCNHRIAAVCARLLSLQLTPTFIISMQGEQDNNLGTTANNYRDRKRSEVATYRQCGVTAPYFVGGCTWRAGAASATVQSGQALATDAGLGIFAGANTDTLNNTYRQDTTHFTASGADAVADLWQDVIEGFIP